jgi:hypothetical protein
MFTDEQRLKFLMQNVDSFFKIEMDRFEYSWEVAEEMGRGEPNAEDELEGFRRMVDDAMVAHKFIKG